MSLMLKKTVLLLSLSLLITLSLYAQSNFNWNHGFKLESEDKNFKFKFGGRIQYDVASIFQSDSLEMRFGEITNGAEFRRVRFFNEGTIYGNVSYKLQVDFIGGKVEFKDVYLEFSKIPVIGNIRVGQFKEPLRLVSLSSSNYLSFMERTGFEGFSPTRNGGIMIQNSYNDDRFAWQLGTYRNSTASGDSPASNDELIVTGRISGMALNNKEKETFLHLGVGVSYRNPKFDNYTVKMRPEAHLTPKYLTTNTIESVNKIILTNVEFAYSRGPLAFLSEYSLSSVDGEMNYSLTGYFAQVSYFLTGEHRPFKSSYGGFGRVKPKKNAGSGGSGAWEVALRYSANDLNDKDLRGGMMKGVTVGLNWLLNPVAKIKFNYVYSYITDEYTVHIAQMRFQIDF